MRFLDINIQALSADKGDRVARRTQVLDSCCVGGIPASWVYSLVSAADQQVNNFCMSSSVMASLASTSCQASACLSSTRSAAHAQATMPLPFSTAYLSGTQLRHTGRLCASTSRLKGRSSQRQRCCQTQAMLGAEGDLVPGVEEGTKIRVIKEVGSLRRLADLRQTTRCICQVSCALQVIVYHAPKLSELQLEGKEGTVKQIVKVFKGKELSANLPYKVEFLLDKEGGKQRKVLAHLVGLYACFH